MVATLGRMPREKKEETETVRLRKTLVRRVARVAAHLGMSVPDYLADRLAGLVDVDEAKLLADLKRERADKCDKPKK